MTPGMLLDGLLAVLVLGAAGWTLAAPTAFGGVIAFVAFGSLLSVVWVRLDAVDVALTEAAIGAGATGLMLLMAVVRLRGGKEQVSAATPSRPVVLLAGLLAATIGGALALAVLALPDPAPGLAAEVRAGSAEVGLGNPVAVVLMAYRGLDTLLEAVVLVFAVVAVWSMAPDRLWGGRPGPRFAPQEDGPFALLARLLPPIGIVVGVHVAWIGADAPGGKFQGGTVIAAMWALAWVAGLVRPPSITDRRLRLVIVAGPLAFILAGLLGWVLGEGFLGWPADFAKPLIKLVEAAMTVSVAAALALLLAGPPERAP
jgi:multisubunit Na+/H+ antiporter MnhB subunit